MPIPTSRIFSFPPLLLAFILLAGVFPATVGCSKSGSGATAPPKGATTVTVTITFPTGQTYQCSDYSVPNPTGAWANTIDGRLDTSAGRWPKAQFSSLTDRLIMSGS